MRSFALPRERPTRANLWAMRKRLRMGVLHARGQSLECFRPRQLQNLYLATVQRSGSQWIRAVMNDEAIRRHSGLSVCPQFRYEWGEFRRRFPLYTFVPGLYVSYPLYEEIAKPPRYRTLYVIRDPRDIVVSWYWAARESHTPMGKILEHRAALRAMPFSEGIEYSIKALAPRFSDIRTWIYGAREDATVKLVRFEELISDPVRVFSEIFDFSGIHIPQGELHRVVRQYSKTRMRERDLAGKPQGATSHYRARKSSHKELFSPRHGDLFDRVSGDLLYITGYRGTAGTSSLSSRKAAEERACSRSVEREDW